MVVGVNGFLHNFLIRYKRHPSITWVCYASHMLVYTVNEDTTLTSTTSTTPSPTDAATFCDLASDERLVKYVNGLFDVCCFGRHCLVVSAGGAKERHSELADTRAVRRGMMGEEGSKDYLFEVFDERCGLVEAKVINIEACLVCMNGTHVFVASTSGVLCSWAYRLLDDKKKNEKTNTKKNNKKANEERKKENDDDDEDEEGEEDLLDFELEDPFASPSVGGGVQFMYLDDTFDIHTCCIEGSDDYLILSNSHGALHLFSLPTLSHQTKLQLATIIPPSHPITPPLFDIALNRDSSILATLDSEGRLRCFSLHKEGKRILVEPIRHEGDSAREKEEGKEKEKEKEKAKEKKTGKKGRKATDTSRSLPDRFWAIHWSEDNPGLLLGLSGIGLCVIDANSLTVKDSAITSGVPLIFRSKKRRKKKKKKKGKKTQQPQKEEETDNREHVEEEAAKPIDKFFKDGEPGIKLLLVEDLIKDPAASVFDITLSWFIR